jgi:phage terminase large subunit-like protein
MPLPQKILWKRISKAEALEQGLGFYFDQAKADHAVGFFENFLIHSKGRFAGQPFTLLPWQKHDVIEEIFGWMRVDTDTRRFRVAYIEVPKKNGKSTLLSGISLYMTVADGEAAAECFGCATSRDQASIVYKQMRELVQASTLLSRRLEVVDSRKTIACVPTNSFWRVISSDSNRAEGLNIHSLCYDEIHSAKDRKLWDSIRYGGISRAQSLVCAITTAGYDRSSICYELHEHALKVMQDQSHDPQFFGYVAGATIDDDYRDPEVWKAANPSFGITMDEADFAADVKEAEGSQTKLSSLLRYRLNVWVQGTNKFVDLTRWEKCRGTSDRLDSSRVWHCGLDLAQTWDVNAFVAVSKGHDDIFDVICKFWIPGDNAEQRREDVPYVIWSKDPKTGLVLTPGDTCDYEFIKRDILDFAKTHQVAKIAADPYNAHHLQQQLQAEGLFVLGFSQNFNSMNAPTRLLETLISQGRLRTNDNPVLNWMAGNCTVRTNADGYIKIQKPNATSPHRVDGMVSLVMALALANDAAAGLKTPDPEIIIL